ncbi:aminopeptidase [Steroidobacter agaridevorans]|uniref:Aminopeptidase n=1 Tax=Steroidobacter agaridevorans TaxID=2695856 RepID=A0A829YKC3_9GAMM|nr:leucyl aminopeptidase family protein [Steroidobacter agaridevorans]GFE83301.1 aminopeptidase [Steroidobacter agaridevorans]GFE86803.1 aminopeptidase [Steroidobacter agaridevorans]
MNKAHPLSIGTVVTTISIPLHLLHEDEFEQWRTAQDEPVRNWAATHSFKAERNKVLLLPGPQGRPVAAIVGVGKQNPREEQSYWIGAGLADRLPDGQYHLATSLPARAATQFAAGWAYGQYRFERYKRGGPQRSVQLRLPEGADASEVERLKSASSLARDLINTPANDMSPEALAQAAVEVARRYGARHRVIIGDDLLKERLPAVHAVGRAAAVAPRLVDIEWGDASKPKVTLVGKGVCFDTGGLDIKPGASMLLMKKDMGGAAVALALAQTIMDAKLPVRLRVILPMVENSIAGNAFRPGDVLGTRKGLTVEVGNTDAEGRLILCDALTLADEEQPDLLIDTATLTGAARVALGPELPALYSNDDSAAEELLRAAAAESDPLWRLPLWAGYDDELSSKIADVNNVSTSGFSGSIIAGLFLRRFVSNARAWVHIDLYAWNGKERPGRPVGAEPQTVRALYAFLKQRYVR